jgi:hypothetical protein
MRKLLVILLVLILAACAAPPVTPTQAPTEEVSQPTQTAAVIVQTVVVTVIPTDLPTEAPTQVPTFTASPLPPTPTEIPPTQPPATEQSASTATSAPAQAADTGSGPVTLDNALGGGWFKDMTLTAMALSLRCQASKQIAFMLTPSDPSIAQADFYYRIEDRATGAVFDWQGPRRMTMDANGKLTLVFSGEDVNPNFRKPNAWFDFQVIGLNKSGGRVGSTEKIVQQVSYTFDCP